MNDQPPSSSLFATDGSAVVIARIREEMQKLGQRRGIATAIAFTGGVVSSCGLVMAASFSRLLTDAVLEVVELGFTVVVGILLDTFLVRPLLVPALATLLGRWNRVWPGSTLWKSVASESVPPLSNRTSRRKKQDRRKLFRWQHVN
ncbi:MAG TPA: MMPL family transporter [Ktedonobacteraceae bacterium]|nr:MMPL family transporter [Ktedonobacteraceae bacterium]